MASASHTEMIASVTDQAVAEVDAAQNEAQKGDETGRHPNGSIENWTRRKEIQK